MKPFLSISRIAVTLVNNTQIPSSVFVIMRAMKNTFRKPKKTTAIRSSKENAPRDIPAVRDMNYFIGEFFAQNNIIV